MNPGDWITFRGNPYSVACAHPEENVVYTLGHPERRLPLDQCEVVRPATVTESNDIVIALAHSSSKSHRPTCARSKVGAILEDYGA